MILTIIRDQTNLPIIDDELLLDTSRSEKLVIRVVAGLGISLG
jgi:hypothetical protein